MSQHSEPSATPQLFVDTSPSIDPFCFRRILGWQRTIHSTSLAKGANSYHILNRGGEYAPLALPM